MKLLLSRSQKDSFFFSLVPLRFGGGVVFVLTAALELTVDEMGLMNKYKFVNSTLIASEPGQDITQAIKSARLIGFLAFIFVMIFFDAGSRRLEPQLEKFGGAILIGFAVTIIMTFFYFGALRNYIRVKDLLGKGRTFYCHSVVELVAKEAELKHLCNALHATVETAKNWGDREVIDIPIQMRPTIQQEHSPLEGWGML